MALGGAVLEGNSRLLEGPLGVVKIGFAGFDLGKTNDDANLTPDQDIKEIMYQQDGTKAADHVKTGIEYILAATFGEIKTGLLRLMMGGISSASVGGATDSGTIGRNIYSSMLNNEANVLKIAAVDENGIASESDEDIMFFYTVIPLVEGELINWGADTQRNFPVSFRIKYYTFPTPHSYASPGGFGYWGDPVDENTLPAVWPDTAAPTLVSAGVDDATDITAIFDENIAFLGAGSFAVGTISAKVEGVLIPAASAVISTTDLTITFPASSFTSGDVVELFITEISIEDTETVANVYGGVSEFPVTNSL